MLRAGRELLATPPSGSAPPHVPSLPYGANRAKSSSEYQCSARVRHTTSRCDSRPVGVGLHGVQRVPQRERRLAAHRPLAHTDGREQAGSAEQVCRGRRDRAVERQHPRRADRRAGEDRHRRAGLDLAARTLRAAARRPTIRARAAGAGARRRAPPRARASPPPPATRRGTRPARPRPPTPQTAPSGAGRPRASSSARGRCRAASRTPGPASRAAAGGPGPSATVRPARSRGCGG